jgi:hypothetical protein
LTGDCISALLRLVVVVLVVAPVDNRCLSGDLSAKMFRDNTSHAKLVKNASAELSLVIYLPACPGRSQLGARESRATSMLHNDANAQSDTRL